MEKFWSNPVVAYIYSIFIKLPPTKKLHNVIAEEVLEKGHALILDIGTGTGVLISKIRKKEPRVEAIGIEPSVQMLAKSKTLVTDSSVHLIRAVGENLPIRGDSIPLIILVFSYHHLNNVLQTISNAYNALKPSGSILIFEADSTLNKNEIKNSYKTIGLPYPLSIIAHHYLKKTGHAVNPSKISEKIRNAGIAKEIKIHRTIKGTPVSVVELNK